MSFTLDIGAGLQTLGTVFVLSGMAIVICLLASAIVRMVRGR